VFPSSDCPLLLKDKPYNILLFFLDPFFFGLTHGVSQPRISTIVLDRVVLYHKDPKLYTWNGCKQKDLKISKNGNASLRPVIFGVWQ